MPKEEPKQPDQPMDLPVIQEQADIGVPTVAATEPEPRPEAAQQPSMDVESNGEQPPSKEETVVVPEAKVERPVSPQPKVQQEKTAKQITSAKSETEVEPAEVESVAATPMEMSEEIPEQARMQPETFETDSGAQGSEQAQEPVPVSRGTDHIPKPEHSSQRQKQPDISESISSPQDPIDNLQDKSNLETLPDFCSGSQPEAQHLHEPEPQFDCPTEPECEPQLVVPQPETEPQPECDTVADLGSVQEPIAAVESVPEIDSQLVQSVTEPEKVPEVVCAGESGTETMNNESPQTEETS